jgi:ribosomal protein L10
MVLRIGPLIWESKQALFSIWVPLHLQNELSLQQRRHLQKLPSSQTLMVMVCKTVEMPARIRHVTTLSTSVDVQ